MTGPPEKKSTGPAGDDDLAFELGPVNLADISTRVEALNSPEKFAVRYGNAITAYLRAILRDSQASDDVLQDFLIKVIERGFPERSLPSGRFRDYLKVAVRNAAITYLRKSSRHAHVDLANDPEFDAQPAEDFDREWQQCILDGAWRALEHQEHRSSRNFYFSVLTLATNNSSMDSHALAGQAAAELQTDMNAAAFRQQLSRARRRFAELICEQVAATLASPTPDSIEAELIDLGLIEFVRKYL